MRTIRSLDKDYPVRTLFSDGTDLLRAGAEEEVPPAGAQAYRNWKQFDPYLNEEEAWPAELFPDADFHYFREAGCLISATAIMLRRFGIEKETDAGKFNPWILNRRLIGCGALTPAADLDLRYIDRLYPLEYLGAVPYSREELVLAVRSGEPFLIVVPGVRGVNHFVVPDCLLPDDVLIIDPGFNKTRLSDHRCVYGLRLFRRTAGGAESRKGSECADSAGPPEMENWDD